MLVAPSSTDLTFGHFEHTATTQHSFIEVMNFSASLSVLYSALRLVSALIGWLSCHDGQPCIVLSYTM